MSFWSVYIAVVVDSVTRTIVLRMQIVASPAAFCFIR